MDLTFLTPLGALFALAALVPLGTLVLRERRARRVRAALRLPQPTPWSLLPLAVALSAVAALLAFAATQPVIQTERTVRERTDAEAFVLLDISRSMLASRAAGAPTRLDRARAVAGALRERLPQVPVGVLSLTDRILPHLFPTTDVNVYRATLAKAVGIERPPPALYFSSRATSLDTLAGVPLRGFYANTARKRLLVVLTDGESRDVTANLRAAYSRRPPIEAFFVHVWDADEAIYETGVPERGYRSDPASARTLAGVAAQVGGRVFGERDGSELAAAAEAFLGTGATRDRTITGERRALMPYLTLAVLVPLGLVLLRRNL